MMKPSFKIQLARNQKLDLHSCDACKNKKVGSITALSEIMNIAGL